MVISISTQEALQRLEAAAGSQSALARALGVSQPTVWHWLNVTRRIPAEKVLKAESLYGVSRHELRPDIYPVERRRARKAVA